jgi:hypothetical protein
LIHLKEKFAIESPQKALIFLERFYVQHSDKVSALDTLREEQKKKQSSENEFMGVPIPPDLTGLPLAVWKNNIKVKTKESSKLK